MVFIKTPLGQSAFQSRSLSLSPRQRSAFIMFDGKRTVDDVMKATTGLGVTAKDVSHLVSFGLLQTFVSTASPKPALSVSEAAVSATATATAMPPVGQTATLAFDLNGHPTVNAQARYSRAYPVAIRLTAALGLRGFRLNLAVERAGNLDKLKELAPKIREAAGAEKFLELENALYY